MAVIKRVKEGIKQLEPGLPTKTLKDGRISKVKIIPFYDRAKLISETLGTLSDALTQFSFDFFNIAVGCFDGIYHDESF